MANTSTPTESNNTCKTPKCSFVDKNGTQCDCVAKCKLNKFYLNYCERHNTIVNEIKEYNKWLEAKKYHEEYEYVGSHWEKAYEDGVDNIYHYIRRDRLKTESKSIEDYDEYDYDDEIWIWQPIWIFCGPNYKSRLESYNYPENYLEQLENSAIVN